MRLPIQFMRRLSHYPNQLIGPTVQEWLFNKSRFQRYGLLLDDLLDETPVVKEALRRLPEDVLDERNFRIIRAGYLSLRKDVLPEAQWTKYEDNIPYLQSIINQVEEEIAEKKAWEKE